MVSRIALFLTSALHTAFGHDITRSRFVRLATFANSHGLALMQLTAKSKKLGYVAQLKSSREARRRRRKMSKSIAFILRGETFRTRDIPSAEFQGEASQFRPGVRITCGGEDRGLAKQNKSVQSHLDLAEAFESQGYAVDLYGLTYPCTEGDPKLIETLPAMYKRRFSKLDVIPVKESTQLSTMIAAFGMALDAGFNYDYYVMLRWDITYNGPYCLMQLLDGLPHDRQWIDPITANPDHLFSIPGGMADDFMAFMKDTPAGVSDGCCTRDCPVICNLCIKRFLESEEITETGQPTNSGVHRPIADVCEIDFEHRVYSGVLIENYPSPFLNDHDQDCDNKDKTL